MLKKIALTALFAITFAVGIGAARPVQAATVEPVESGLCLWGLVC